MKKAISVLLTMIMLLGTVCIFANANETSDPECKFAFTTDLHYVHPLSNAKERMLDLYPELCMGSRNNLQSESGFIIDEFLKQCAEDDDCEFVLISGDLVTYGRERTSDHIELAKKFREFEKSTGKQIYVINGNHDNGLGYSTDHNKFVEIYYEFGYDTAFSVDSSCCSYATELNDDYILIALDTLDEQYMLASGVDYSRLKWVKEQCDYAKKTGKHPIVMMHHNLLEHQPLQAIVNGRFIVTYPKSIATMFADWGIRFVLTGHTHTNDVSVFTTPLGNKVYEFCNSALNTYPLEYKIFKFSDDVISYETKGLENVDADALTSVITSGYSEHELGLIYNDFKQFAKEYNIGNNMAAIKRGITPEYFGFEKDSLLYDNVKKITDALAPLTNMPLYSENGVKSVAEKYGISIPDTSYDTVYDIAEKLYIDVLTGNRHYDFDSPEMSVIIATIETAINMSYDTSNSEMLYKIANDIIEDKKVDLSVKVTSAAEYLALAIVSPYLYEYINSTDGIDNRNGEIPGYASSETRTDNIAAAIKTTYEALTLYIKMISEFMLRFFTVLFGNNAL